MTSGGYATRTGIIASASIGSVASAPRTSQRRRAPAAVAIATARSVAGVMGIHSLALPLSDTRADPLQRV